MSEFARIIGENEPIPPQYKYLAGFINEPVPDYSLMTLPAEAERKIDQVMKQLKEGVEGIQNSENFRQFLTTMAKFHNYSIGNQILIMLQKRDATRVAGFNTWKDLGRFVKKGEKGIAILAPVFPPRPTCDSCGAKVPKDAQYCPKCGQTFSTSMEDEPHFFRVVYVFDLSQTEGKDLPDIEVPSLSGTYNQVLFDKVKSLVKERGLTLSFESKPDQDPDRKGYFTPGLIWIRPEEPPAQQLKTLIHETAHFFTESVFRIPRQDAETIAESAAYVVATHYGFDTGIRSFPYVAIWSKEKKVLEKNLNDIRKVATVIMEALDKQSTGITAPRTLKTRAISESLYSLSQLKIMAGTRGLSTAGTKRDIVRRLNR